MGELNMTNDELDRFEASFLNIIGPKNNESHVNKILKQKGNLYFGFDMDATIGNVHQFHKLIQKYPQGNPVYDKIISFIANEERTIANEERKNLSVFNPLIVGTLQKIAEKNKIEKRIYCMIYSNHGDLKMVQFASDVLEKIIGEKLFCAHVHYSHSIRKDDDKILNKTWDTFQNIFTELCGVPEPTPENSVFFDDLEHTNLKQTLGDNYIQVTPYNVRCLYFPERIKDLPNVGGGRKLNTQKNRKNRKNFIKNIKRTLKKNFKKLYPIENATST